MNSNTAPLQEQIEAALIRATEDGADRTEHYAAAVLPIIRAAQADALRSAVQDMGDWADEVYVTGDPLDEDTWADITTGEWLTARADTIEKEAVTW